MSSERHNPVWGYVAVVAMVLGMLAKLLIGSGFSGPTHKSGAGSTLAIVFVLLIALFVGLAGVRKLAWTLPKIPRRMVFASISLVAAWLWFGALEKSDLGNEWVCEVVRPSDAEYRELLGTTNSPEFLSNAPWGERFSDLREKGEVSAAAYQADWSEAPADPMTMVFWHGGPPGKHVLLGADEWSNDGRVRYVRISGPIEVLQAATSTWGDPIPVVFNYQQAGAWLHPETRIRARLHGNAHHPECPWTGSVMYERYSEIDDVLGQNVHHPFAAIDQPLLGMSLKELKSREGSSLLLEPKSDTDEASVLLPPLAYSDERPRLTYELDEEQRIRAWTLEISECSTEDACEPLAFARALERFGPFIDPPADAPKRQRISRARPSLSIDEGYNRRFFVHMSADETASVGPRARELEGGVVE